MIFSGAIKRMMERGLLVLLTRWLAKLGSEFCCLIFAHTWCRCWSNQKSSQILLKNLGLSFFVLHGRIVFRCEIKKILHSERLDWPQIEITMRWSEICLLFTAKLWSDNITRDIINLAHHSRSKLLLLGLFKSVAGARSRRCSAARGSTGHR